MKVLLIVIPKSAHLRHDLFDFMVKNVEVGIGNSDKILEIMTFLSNFLVRIL